MPTGVVQWPTAGLAMRKSISFPLGFAQVRRATGSEMAGFQSSAVTAWGRMGVERKETQRASSLLGKAGGEVRPANLCEKG